MLTIKKIFSNLILILIFIKFKVMISKGTERSLAVAMLIAFLIGLMKKI